MMMKEKQFKLIADALSVARDYEESFGIEGNVAVVDRVAIGLAHTLGNQNPRFDTDRFLNAAGLQ